MLVQVLATAATVLTLVSASIRFVETRRSDSVSGLSDGFAWLAVLCNVGWLTYGITAGVVPQIVGSAAWLFSFGYVLYRRWGYGAARWMWYGIFASVALVAVGVWRPDLAGWFAGLLGVGSSVPQLVKIWRTGDPSGVGPRAWTFSLGMGLLWFTYGLVGGFVPVMATNGLYSLLVVGILLGYARAVRLAKGPLGASEAVSGPLPDAA